MNDPVAEFIIVGCAPRDASHSDGTLGAANAILAAHPEVATANIHTAAILGDGGTVTRLLAQNPANGTAKGGPHAWDALTHLCFSRYLKLERERTDGFVRAATALLDAGASANTGWFEQDHEPRGTWESVLYGASGIAHHPEMTRLLVERGADVNDDETVYHTPESYDNRSLAVLVETGRMTPENLSMMLIRKHDWHDYDGARYLLEHGADPNGGRSRGWLPMHHALARGNSLAMIQLLLDHRAGATLLFEGRSAIPLAVREGRADVLALFEQRGFPLVLPGVDELISACARDQSSTVRAIASREPHLVRELLDMGGTLLAKFASNGNTEGVRQLLNLGVDAAEPFVDGDPYFGIPENSLAIHIAAWRAQPAIVRLLIERGSPVDTPDANKRTPLALAIRACVDSYWTERRSPESVQALLDAGASVKGVPYPSGYAEVDELIRAQMR